MEGFCWAGAGTGFYRGECSVVFLLEELLAWDVGMGRWADLRGGFFLKGIDFALVIVIRLPSHTEGTAESPTTAESICP